MTPQAQLMQAAMQSIEKLDDESFIKIAKKLEKSQKTIVKLYREIIYDNYVLFQRIFIVSYKKEIRTKILASYLGVSETCINMSPSKEELEKLSLYMMTCECLAEIYKFIKISLGLSSKEFVVSWHMLNESEELKNMFFDAKLDPELLDEKTKKYYLKEKEAQVAEKEFIASKKAKE